MARAWVGTSGFSYKQWKPNFYPEDLTEKQFLNYYASRLNSVEIDYTFYRMPTLKTIDAWKAAVHDGFRFALKASQRITHRERLQIPSEALEYLMTTVPKLEGSLGVVLFQLPPFFRCDHQRLEMFLATLPRGVPRAFEFRHPSWFTTQVYQLLERYGAALCIHDADDHTTPIEITAGYTYVRLRRSEYKPRDREEWRDRMRAWMAREIEVFAYIKHEDNPNAPLIALEFAELVHA